MKIHNALFFCGLILISACAYNNEEELYPASACDTTNVTFSGKIAPILAYNCLACHSDANAAVYGSGVHLQAYADVKSLTTAISGAINHTAGHFPMPKYGGKLNTCSLKLFEIWIRTGTPY